MKGNVEFVWGDGVMGFAYSFSCQTQLQLRLSLGFDNLSLGSLLYFCFVLHTVL